MSNKAIELEQKLRNFITDNFDASVVGTEKKEYDYSPIGDGCTEITVTVELEHDVPDVNEGTIRYDILKALITLDTDQKHTSGEVASVINHDARSVSSRLSEMHEEGLVIRDSASRPFAYKMTGKGIWALAN